MHLDCWYLDCPPVQMAKSASNYETLSELVTFLFTLSHVTFILESSF